MKHPCVIRVAKLQTMGNIAASGQHTWRERFTKNADPKRLHLNEDWRPVSSSTQLVQAVKERLKLADKVDQKRVPCLEYVITANRQAFKEAGGELDGDAYCRDSLAWVEARHGAANVVAVNVQNDELAKHVVIYVVPLIEEKAKLVKRSVIVGKNADGSVRREVREVEKKASCRLSAATFVDGPAKLSALQTEFAEQVGAKHGLVRGIKGSQATHTTVQEWYAALDKPAVHVAMTPDQVAPKVIKKGLLKTEYETHAQVAARLNKGVKAFYSSTVSAAKTAALDRKRKDEVEGTLQGLQGLYGAFFPLLDVVGSLGGEKRALEALREVAEALEAERHLESMLEMQQELDREHEMQMAARNMTLANPGLDWDDALERAERLMSGGDPEFDTWLRYEPVKPVQASPVEVSAKSQENGGPSFER